MLFLMRADLFVIVIGIQYLWIILQKNALKKSIIMLLFLHAVKKLIRLIFALQKSEQPYLANI